MSFALCVGLSLNPLAGAVAPATPSVPALSVPCDALAARSLSALPGPLGPFWSRLLSALELFGKWFPRKPEPAPAYVRISTNADRPHAAPPDPASIFLAKALRHWDIVDSLDGPGPDLALRRHSHIFMAAVATALSRRAGDYAIDSGTVLALETLYSLLSQPERPWGMSDEAQSDRAEAERVSVEFQRLQTEAHAKDSIRPLWTTVIHLRNPSLKEAAEEVLVDRIENGGSFARRQLLEVLAWLNDETAVAEFATKILLKEINGQSRFILDAVAESPGHWDAIEWILQRIPGEVLGKLSSAISRIKEDDERSERVKPLAFLVLNEWFVRQAENLESEQRMPFLDNFVGDLETQGWLSWRLYVFYLEMTLNDSSLPMRFIDALATLQRERESHDLPTISKTLRLYYLLRLHETAHRFGSLPYPDSLRNEYLVTRFLISRLYDGNGPWPMASSLFWWLRLLKSEGVSGFGALGDRSIAVLGLMGGMAEAAGAIALVRYSEMSPWQITIVLGIVLYAGHALPLFLGIDRFFDRRWTLLAPAAMVASLYGLVAFSQVPLHPWNSGVSVMLTLVVLAHVVVVDGVHAWKALRSERSGTVLLRAV